MLLHLYLALEARATYHRNLIKSLSDDIFRVGTAGQLAFLELYPNLLHRSGNSLG